MNGHPAFAYVTLSSARADQLTKFYSELTGAPVTFADGAFTVIGGGEADGARRPLLAFQQVATGQPLVPAHVDFHVGDIERASARVTSLGGTLGTDFAEVGSVWRQAFDPDGNVFCLMRSG